MALMIPLPIMRCYRFDGLQIDFPLGFPGILRVGVNPKTNLKALSLELVELLTDQEDNLPQHCLSAPEIVWVPFLLENRTENGTWRPGASLPPRMEVLGHGDAAQNIWFWLNSWNNS